METLTIHVHPRKGCGWSIFAEPGQGISRVQIVDTTITGTLDGDTFRCVLKGDRYTAHRKSLEDHMRTGWITVEGWQIETPEWVWEQSARPDLAWGIPAETERRARVGALRQRVAGLAS